MNMIRTRGGCFADEHFVVFVISGRSYIGVAGRRALSISRELMRLALAEVLHVTRNE